MEELSEYLDDSEEIDADSDGNLAVVGDDDQSIYGFRGARPEVMLRFQDFYPDVKFVRMNTNYRSCSGIIAAADCLIKQNSDRFEKEFQAFNQESGSVEVISKSTRQIELFTVMTKIKALIDSGEDPSNIAVLYRTNQQSEDMVALLMAQNIPFVSTEKIPSRYQHWMFEDIKSYQKLAKGEKWSKQDLARVLNHPQRFLGNSAYVNAGLNEQKMTSVAFKLIPAGWKRDNAISSIHKFFLTIRKLKSTKPSVFLKVMDTYGNYRQYLKEYAEFWNMDLQELIDIWTKYTEDAQKHDDWVEWGRYIMGYNKAIEDAQKNKTGVALSTMHCSKGLEWKHVFIIDCVEGVTPFEKAQTAAAIEEERRLFYVAMTRAKEALYLCTYSERAKKQVKRSRFLN